MSHLRGGLATSRYQNQFRSMTEAIVSDDSIFACLFWRRKGIATIDIRSRRGCRRGGVRLGGAAQFYQRTDKRGAIGETDLASNGVVTRVSREVQAMRKSRFRQQQHQYKKNPKHV